MRTGFELPVIADLPHRAKEMIWIVLVTASSVLFSFAMSCAAPLAGLAAIAGLMMPLRGAITLVTAAWLTHQAIGYLILGYPQTWDSFAWGAALGISALLATLAARSAGRAGAGLLVTLAAAFAYAFLAYEVFLFLVGTMLPSGAEAFEWPVVVSILSVNLLAFAGLLGLHRLAVAIGLLARSGMSSPVVAGA